MLEELKVLEAYWNALPIGKENAYTYEYLCNLWNCDKRKARAIMHDLSIYDNGDNYILIRSGKCKGFYKTDDRAEIEAYKRECLNKGRSVFAPVKKINRVLDAARNRQYNFYNNLRVVRESMGLTQSEVCEKMGKMAAFPRIGEESKTLDKYLLSKIENGVILPTPYQLILLSKIYGVESAELLQVDLY